MTARPAPNMAHSGDSQPRSIHRSAAQKTPMLIRTADPAYARQDGSQSQECSLSGRVHGGISGLLQNVNALEEHPHRMRWIRESSMPERIARKQVAELVMNTGLWHAESRVQREAQKDERLLCAHFDAQLLSIVRRHIALESWKFQPGGIRVRPDGDPEARRKPAREHPLGRARSKLGLDSGFVHIRHHARLKE